MAADLKAVYRDATAAEAERQLEAFAAEWNARYTSISKSWRANWARIVPMFGLPDDIRRAVYTTNAIFEGRVPTLDGNSLTHFI